jgi:hypothetical protein
VAEAHRSTELPAEKAVYSHTPDHTVSHRPRLGATSYRPSADNNNLALSESVLNTALAKGRYPEGNYPVVVQPKANDNANRAVQNSDLTVKSMLSHGEVEMAARRRRRLLPSQRERTGYETRVRCQRNNGIETNAAAAVGFGLAERESCQF